jgi:hypothetical protein
MSKEICFDANKDNGLVVDTDMKYVFMSYHQNEGQNHDMKIVERNHVICGTVQISGNFCDENSTVV